MQWGEATPRAGGRATARYSGRVPPKKPQRKAPGKAAKRGTGAKAKPFYRTCSRCGRMEECPEGGLPAGWSVSMEARRVEYLDPGCARANIRAIEGRLTEEYWEF